MPNPANEASGDQSIHASDDRSDANTEEASDSIQPRITPTIPAPEMFDQRHRYPAIIRTQSLRKTDGLDGKKRINAINGSRTRRGLFH